MYILILAQNYPDKKWPLAGIFEFDQAKALQDMGHSIIFASIDLRSIRRWRKFGTQVLVKDGITIYNLSIPLGTLPWWVLHYVGMAGLLFLYYKINKENGKPDIVHSHFTTISAIAVVLKKIYKLPLVVTEHSSEINRDTISKRTKYIGNIAFKNADKIISVSSKLSRKIKQNFGFESDIIPNIVDTSIFKFNPKKEINTFTFISVGHLVYGKGHDLLIQAFHNANFNQQVYLNIIGEGKLHKKLQYKINSLNLNKQIKLLGSLSRSEIVKQMQKSDAFVLASRGETFGVVYIEALSSGLPVICTECGGPEDFVNKKNGIITPLNDIFQLSESMRDLKQNIDRYKNEEISQQSILYFSPENIGIKLTELYNKLLNDQIISIKTNL